jgi:cytochrome P450
VDRLAGTGALFDQHGDAHRQSRRDMAALLGAAGVERLRPVWTALLDKRLAALSAGQPVDLVQLAAEIAGSTAAALLSLNPDPPAPPGLTPPGPPNDDPPALLSANRHGLLGGDPPNDDPPALLNANRHGLLGGNPLALAYAARAAGAAAARAHLPGPGRRRAGRRAEDASRRLVSMVGGANAGLNAVLTVAAVNTTVAALPRAAAWACWDGLWEYAADPALADELMRVLAPTPLLPRVAAGDGELDGGRCPVRGGDRLLLIARHAAGAHRRDPDPVRPAPVREALLVFGAGPHTCPGARLARAQLTDFLVALAPHRPVVVRARADRRSALPGWRTLVVRATR